MVGDSIRRANIHIEQVFREVNIGHVGREYLSSVVAKEFLGILMFIGEIENGDEEEQDVGNIGRAHYIHTYITSSHAHYTYVCDYSRAGGRDYSNKRHLKSE